MLGEYPQPPSGMVLGDGAPPHPPQALRHITRSLAAIPATELSPGARRGPHPNPVLLFEQSPQGGVP